MRLNKTQLSIFLSVVIVGTACKSRLRIKEEDKIFHAGPVQSSFGTIFFSLYKDNKYQFCDGDFMNDGCYTGEYTLSGDTLLLYDLKEHKGIPSDRFLIRRYHDMDSSYWQWKYPDHKGDWTGMRRSDSLRGADGDVLYLNSKGEIVLEGDNYFLIRLDSLKNYR
jgi:hypothetical protein